MVNYVIERERSNVFNANVPFSIALFPQILYVICQCSNSLSKVIQYIL
jgi:hypothetical protein